PIVACLRSGPSRAPARSAKKTTFAERFGKLAPGMDFELGIVCGRCDLYSAMGTATCPSCGNLLALFTWVEANTDPQLQPPVVLKAAYTEPPPSLLAEPLRPRRSGSSPQFAAGAR